MREWASNFTHSRDWFSFSARTFANAAQGAALVEFGQKHVMKGLSRTTDGVVTKAEGSYMHFADGRKMLDFTTGIGVTVLGMSIYSDMELLFNVL
jgi:4-aminobutyrate aminotransferase-like enzyme